MYIGHIPNVGNVALTGVGVSFPIIMIISACAFLFGAGGAPRASIYMGKQDNDTAENILGNCFISLVIAAISLTVIILLLKNLYCICLERVPIQFNMLKIILVFML